MAIMKCLYLIFMLVVMSGCVKYTVIADPPGADVTINGEYYGKSPVTAKADCRTWGDRPIVDIRKEGYTPINGKILPYETNFWVILADIPIWPAIFLNSQCPQNTYTLKLWPEEKVTQAK